MKFAITGLNHTTAPVEIRERLAFPETALAHALDELRRETGLGEAVILSTCNRVEVAAATPDERDARDAVEGFLAASRGVDREWLRPHLYHHEGRAAVRHLFRVAASLDSMVVGEPQILGQLKAAYVAARESGAASGPLEGLFSHAFRVAKRVRTETEIGQSAVSVSYAAVELARQIFGSLSGRKVILVGAGKMSELAARHLKRSGCGQMFVTNRTLARAEEMAALFDGRLIEYTRFAEVLAEIDILLASSAAPHYILNKEDVRRALAARRNRPMFLIDIAVPRNIEPAVNELDNVFLYDMDDLQKVVESNRLGRVEEAAEAEVIVEEEVDRMMARLVARDAGPVIVELQQQLETLRQGEIERLRGKLGPLTPQQEEALEALTRGLVNKIAHGPISELRRGAQQLNGLPVADFIRRIFRLGKSS
ncbi:MAG: glutamyl-tRNA reductase [Bryobacteraceae bacterium]